MEIKVNIDDKLIEEVKYARSTLAKIKAAIDKARKAAAKWFSSEDLKLSDDAEKKINDAHLVYNQKIAEITNVVIESILGQKIDVDAEIEANNENDELNNEKAASDNKNTESYRQVKDISANADTEPKTLRELAKQSSTEQVKKEDAQNITDLPDDLNDERVETTTEQAEKENNEPTADKMQVITEELPEFIERIKKANTKEEINKLVGEARVKTAGADAKRLSDYNNTFISTQDYDLLQQALADREQEIKKNEIKPFRFLRRASEFKSSHAVRIAYDFYKRIRGDKEITIDYLRESIGWLSKAAEKAQLMAEVNTYARNIGQGKE